MAVDTTMKVLRLTGDDNNVATIQGISLLHGVIAITSTLTAAASVLIYDLAAASAGSEVIELHANTPDGTNYEKTFGCMFAYPLKLFTDVSVNVTNLAACYIYYT